MTCQAESMDRDVQGMRCDPPRAAIIHAVLFEWESVPEDVCGAPTAPWYYWGGVLFEHPKDSVA